MSQPVPPAPTGPVRPAGVPAPALPSARLWPVLALTFNAFVWGVSWWPLRWLQGLGVHPLWATALVYGASCVVLLALHRGALAQVLGTRSLWVIMLAAGTTNACFNWGVTIGEVLRVVLLFYLMPLWSMLFARVLLHEPLTRAAAVRVALAVGGAALVLTGGHADSPAGPRPLAWLGDVLGVLGGMSFALNNVMLRRAAALPTAARSLAMFLGGAVVAALAALAVPGSTAALAGAASAGGWWWLGALGLGLLIILSNLTLQYGAARLPARVTSLVMLSEVVFAAVSSVGLGGEPLTAQLLAGAALIMGAAALATLERPAASGQAPNTA